MRAAIMAKYIYRHDIEKQHIGWYVVIEHRCSAIRRYFSDATYGGGKVNSLMAALEFRKWGSRLEPHRAWFFSKSLPCVQKIA